MKELLFEKDDLLLRKNDANHIMEIINVLEKYDRNNLSFSIAINAKWGDGKTFFVNMWKNWLEESNQNYTVIYYNAWEYDDSESSLLPLLYKIISLTNRREDEKFIEQVKIFLKACGYATIKFGINKLVGENLGVSNILTEGIDNLSNEKVMNVFEEYNEYYNKKEILSEKIQELIPNKGKLWIFIDELDRCRPDFALNTLEIVKHYFNIENVIFVFSVDLEQLSKTIARVYGNGIDSDSYLKKFFDFTYNLTSPDIEKYIKIKTGMVRNLLISEVNQNYIIFLFRKFNLSLRDIDLIFNHYIYFLNHYHSFLKNRKKGDRALHTYLFFIVIKDKFNNEYRRILHGRFSMKNGNQNKWKPINKRFLINNNIKELLEDISEGRADSQTKDLIEKYDLFEIPKISIFSKHMEMILNYWVGE